MEKDDNVKISSYHTAINHDFHIFNQLFNYQSGEKQRCQYKNNSIYTTYNIRLKNSGVISPHEMKHKSCFNKLLLIQGPLVKH